MKNYNDLLPGKSLSLSKLIEYVTYYSINDIEQGHKFYSSSMLDWPVFNVCGVSDFDKSGVLSLNTRAQNRHTLPISRKAHNQNTYEKCRNNYRWRIKNAKILQKS